jgi:hypothetical protein
MASSHISSGIPIIVVQRTTEPVLFWDPANSMGQIFWTHQDSGRTNFNFPKIFGNATAVAISNLYYQDDRAAHDGVSSLVSLARTSWNAALALQRNR